MLRKEARIQPFMGSKNMNVCDRASEKSGRFHSPRPLPWYLAPGAWPKLKYVLTSNGYIALP